jgi:heme exporter protein C
VKTEAPPLGWTALAGTTAVLLAVTLYLIFFYAPVELQMGIAQKIFYFHVPSAWGMYIGFITAGVASGIYLWKRTPGSDAWAVAGAEVGLLFCAIVLITGPLWARKAWGVFWTWDPRLTSTLFAAMIFAAYVGLRSFGAAGETEKKFAAGLAILGVVDLPLIHYAVELFRGQHPTVITERGGGLDPKMRVVFLVASISFIALASLLLWTRARIERTRARVIEAEVIAAERGLLEDA